MKSLITILAVLCFLPLANANEPTQAQSETTTTQKEPVGETAKKRLRHMGQNIERLGKKAGKKVGVKTSEPPPAPSPEVPAPNAPKTE